MVYIFLAEGFEEIEALGTMDLLRRAGIDVRSVSIGKDRYVTGSHNIRVEADILLEQCNGTGLQGVILPGGMPGSANLNACEGVKALVKECFLAGGLVAAICAAPMVLGGMGLLKGKRATCYSGFEKYLEGAEYTSLPVECDGNVITGNGPGAFSMFAYRIISVLKDEKTAAEVLAGGRFIK